MKKVLQLLFFIICTSSTSAIAQQQKGFDYQLNKDGSVYVKSEDGGALLIKSTFIVLKRIDNPSIHFENQSKNLTKFKDAVTVPCWKSVADTITPNYFQTAKFVRITASSVKVTGRTLHWIYPQNNQFVLEASLTLGPGHPEISFRITSRDNAYYSVGFAGMPQFDPETLNELLQPWIWQGKRFPSTSYLSTEDMCPLPAVLLNKAGVTCGLIPDPDQIPYRLPALRKGNIKYGLLIRNERGKAQPMLFSPVLGNPDSYLAPGSTYSFALQVILKKANISVTHQFIAEHIFRFKDYRQNVFNSLNTTIENMIDYGTNNTYNGWNADLKGFDYTLDVARTVKVVSGMHPLSIANLTDNESIYWNWALPITEFNLSRERFLFSVANHITDQNASSRLNGPGIEVAELAALNSYYQQHTPIFSYFANSLKDTTRVLNLGIKSDGNAWPNLIGLYKDEKNPAFLKAALADAGDYIKKRVNTAETDFKFAGGDKTGRLSADGSSHFWTDYTPKWMELLDLYELTGNKNALDAALKGARQYAQYVWFSPRIPDTTYLTTFSKQPVPAWRVSPIGLTPEAANTFHDNPGIFLTQFAPHFLRLAYYTNDNFLRSIARSAVIGRYANFPGYTIGGFDAVYSRPDYPYNNNLHGLFYYNHIWPQIAMLFDYLISDTFAQSQAKIDFPHEFVPAYAYLKSRVYGNRPGKFYTDALVHLWMPRQLLDINNEQINYISGYGNGNFYVALLNQSDKPVTAIVKINTDLTGLDINHTYQVRLWQNNQPVFNGPQLKNGEISVLVPAKGISAFAVDALTIHAQFQQKIYQQNEKVTDKSFKIINTPAGKLSSAMIALGPNLKSWYLWSSTLPQNTKKLTVQYRFAESDPWETYTDQSYPYEFSLRLNKTVDRIEYKATFFGAGDHILYETGTQSLEDQ